MQDQTTTTPAALGLDPTSLRPIQRNKYCAIACARRLDGQRCIIKEYGDSDPVLARREAEALDCYDAICRDLPALTTCRLLAYSRERNALAMSFVDGGSYTRLVYRGVCLSAHRRQAIAHAHTLGRLLRALYRRRHDRDGVLGDFMREYLLYASARLAAIPLLGKVLLGKARPTAESLFDEARDCGEPVSFCHGDCVPRNLHAHGGAIGLIDWANTATDSHILNDVYNLHIALRNMVLPARYRRQLLGAFSEGLGDLCFDIRLHRFFHEYHRRRWLMLKLHARRPWPWLQALRGRLTFARPFAPTRLGILRRHVKEPA